MPRIRQLPTALVTQIAAGEVVERPASVVKELLENSVDAGSTRVDVDLEAGGMDLIRVADDGCGMAADDLPLAFAPHATSKLRTAADLFAVRTMGFRGEALASVAGVARVGLQSRPHEAPAGAELRCDGGERSPPRPWNGSPGTRVEVRHLLFNVPVRKKFLKNAGTEFGHVCEAVTRVALANPETHLTLRHNGKVVYDIPATAGLTDRIALFFGGGVRDALYHLDSGPGPVRLTGWVADPALDRSHGKLQYLFVNGRWVRDRGVTHAVQEALRGLLMAGRRPVTFLFLTVPPDRVDVNIHPTKSEVRFRDGGRVHALVERSVRARLAAEALLPHATVAGVPEPKGGGPEAEQAKYVLRPTTERDVGPARPAADPRPSPRADAASRTVAPWERPGRATDAGEPGPGKASRGLDPTPGVPSGHTGVPAGRVPDHAGAVLASLGPADERAGTTVTPPLPVTPDALPADVHSAIQIQDTYLVVGTADGMLVIDQHALHERILFEQLRERVRGGRLEVQRLLVPEPIDLSAEQAAVVLGAVDALRDLGLEVSDFGGDTVLLSSYPTLLGGRPPRDIFRGVADDLLANDRPPTRDALLHLLTATMACRAAVKAGDRLTPGEVAHLLRLRHLTADSHHCPHGRPTTVLFSRRDLDKQFRRV